MSPVRGGELFEQIQPRGEPDTKLARKYFQQLVDGIGSSSPCPTRKCPWTCACQGIQHYGDRFEIKASRIARLLLEQYFTTETNRAARELANQFKYWAQRFEELPLLFLSYYGSQPIDRVLDAMNCGNYVHDASHLVLDNLQFIPGSQLRGASQLDAVHEALQKLWQFATGKNVHVSLVVHPRKENDEQAIIDAELMRRKIALMSVLQEHSALK